MSAVELDGVSKRYGGLVAVDDLTLDVPAGEFFALLGPSGCGKTSTLRMIAGFEVPSSGRVRLDGQDVTGLRPHRRPVNTVFQSYALFPHLSVVENVAFGLRRRGVRDIAAQVDDMLELVQLPGVGPRRPHELSGGQQQRVALARALINRPKVLLLDEPLGALDLALRRAMQLELKRIQRDVGITFVHVTHDQEEAMTLADRIAVMRAGRIEQHGTPEELYSRPRTEFVAGFLGRSNLLDGSLCGLPAGTRVGIRPERVRLLPAPAAPAGDGELGLAVTVLDRGFMGTSTQFVVVTAWGQELVAVTQDPADLRPGDAGELRWERSRMFELDAVVPGAVLVP